MKKSFCETLLDYYPTNAEVKELYWTLIANDGVFNSFLSYTAIMLNILTIHAIRKTSSMPRSLKTLLLSLAVSDVGVGLLGQPLYISLLSKLFPTVARINFFTSLAICSVQLRSLMSWL